MGGTCHNDNLCVLIEDEVEEEDDDDEEDKN